MWVFHYPSAIKTIQWYSRPLSDLYRLIRVKTASFLLRLCKQNNPEMSEGVPESPSWEEQRDGRGFLCVFDPEKTWPKTHKKILGYSEIQLKNLHLDLVFVFWGRDGIPGGRKGKLLATSPGQAYYFGIQKVSLRPKAYFLVRLFQFLPPPP